MPRRLATTSGLQPGDRPPQPLLRDRLQKVVEAVDRVRLHRVVLVRGHEHDERARRPRRQLARGVDTGQLGHRDVAEDDVVVEARRQRERLAHGRGLADHLDAVGPLEQVAQLGARRRLVVDDQREQAHVPVSSTCAAAGTVGSTIDTSVPSRGAETTRNRPSSP